ncbi:MAG: alpha/beta hydrolase, partial [Nitrosarchaeum sp.]|nr:alpha/beta hydrolase [Nitrosarchaeum sp.]
MTGCNKLVDSMIIDEFVTRMQEPNSKMIMTSVLLGLKDSDITKKLSEIHCPSLVIWRDKDPVIPPRYAKFFVSLIKNCDFVLMKGCGHTPFAEKPDEFSETVSRFLLDYQIIK